MASAAVARVPADDGRGGRIDRYEISGNGFNEDVKNPVGSVIVYCLYV